MNDYYFERIENSRYARVNGLRHQKVLKLRRIRHLIFMAALFIAIVIISMLSIRHFTFADDSDINVRKQYKSVMIYCGDTVSDLSEDFIRLGYPSKEALQKEICSINSISLDSRLIAGNYIIIPYYENIY